MSRHSSSLSKKPEDFHQDQTSYVQYKTGEVAPQDSDTDSGICADYDQPSPKQRVEIPPIFSTINTTDYLSRELHRRLITSFEASLPRQSVASKSEVVRSTKAYRVRFADEVESASSIGSDYFDESNKFLRNAAVDRWQQQFSQGKKKKCESIRDFVIRQNVYDALKWTLHNRSSSLPRLEKYEISEFYCTPTRGVNYQVDHLHRFSGDNIEKLNVHSDKFSNTNNNTPRRRRLPVVPLFGSSRLSEPHQEDVHSSNHLCSAQQRPREFIKPQQFARRSTSVGRKCEVLQYGTRGKTPPVRAILVALDQCGLRTVLVEKTQPGPFGFYVAIGTLNGQRGIFISRISISSLSPMLSVGDEILYVDEEHVRGRSLETVQAVISGKTKILLVLLPAAENYVH